ncbi:hypothetical protein [Litoribacillus peritrichatus]|uniref:Uncharacterized protein n=1 Tax=Litoribacillus peritrichatus TaxID=718191 RepID=A0ABP7N2Y0_9GAMM
MDILIITFAIIIVLIGVYQYKKALKRKRAVRIDSYQFPKSIPEKIIKTYPHLSEEQVNQVMSGLREYFHICNLAGRKMVAMPSQAVDLAWHEFILFTKHYELFCKHCLGRFLHHTPAEAMSTPTLAQDGIKRVWRISCHREVISPIKPKQLPMLFAMDASLKIPDGFNYSLNCKHKNQSGYCASHIGCGGGCTGDSGGSSCGSSCGGGCGGGD